MDWWTLPLIATGILTGLTIIGILHLAHIHRSRSQPTQGPHPPADLNSPTTTDLEELTTDDPLPDNEHQAWHNDILSTRQTPTDNSP